MNLRERHSHVFKDPRKKERCDAAQLLAAGDALSDAVGRYCVGGVDIMEEGADAVRAALANWEKVTDGK